jgi:hypothetical protein
MPASGRRWAWQLRPAREEAGRHPGRDRDDHGPLGDLEVRSTASPGLAREPPRLRRRGEQRGEQHEQGHGDDEPPEDRRGPPEERAQRVTTTSGRAGLAAGFARVRARRQWDGPRHPGDRLGGTRDRGRDHAGRDRQHLGHEPPRDPPQRGTAPAAIAAASTRSAATSHGSARTAAMPASPSATGPSHASAGSMRRRPSGPATSTADASSAATRIGALIPAALPGTRTSTRMPPATASTRMRAAVCRVMRVSGAVPGRGRPGRRRAGRDPCGGARVALGNPGSAPGTFQTAS